MPLEFFSNGVAVFKFENISNRFVMLWIALV